MKLRQLDRRFLAREDEPEDIEVARTNGCSVYDERGRRYIDFLSGWCVGNFGWDNRDIAKRPRRRRLTTSGAAITMFPPLTLDRRTAKQGLDIFERALS